MIALEICFSKISQGTHHRIRIANEHSFIIIQTFDKELELLMASKEFILTSIYLIELDSKAVHL